LVASAIITKFENMVGESLDADFSLQLVNDAMHEVEEDIRPAGLKAVDSSDSTAVGQTYATAMDLPEDFFLPCPVIYVGTTPYTQIPLELATSYRDQNGFFYVDLANHNYHLCGTQTSVQTITFPYFFATPDLTTTPDTEPVWPEQFHRIIPLKMAELYYAIDAGEKSRSWDDRWTRQYEIAVRRFREYDARIKLASMDRSSALPNGPTDRRELQIDLE
jgi:hypothetical protein